MNRVRRILLLGGAGFIGKQLAFVLANRGWTVTVPSRRPQRQRELQVHPRINLVAGNPTLADDLERLCQGQHAVVNLIGILNEKQSGDFRRYHVDFVKQLLETCNRLGIRRLMHLSALGANQATGSSAYLRSKGEGENLLHTFGQRDFDVTSFQPSVVFGREDDFINRFAGLLGWMIGPFPLACASSRLQPVYVGDLVLRIAAAVDDRDSYGERYPVCGPEVFSLRQIVELIIAERGLPVRVLPLGRGLSRLQAVVMQRLPGKLFTLDNFLSLQTDNVCGDAATCGTSLRHYLAEGVAAGNARRHYDRFRQNLPGRGRGGDQR